MVSPHPLISLSVPYLDGPDLLAHEDEITDAKGEKGNRHNGDQVRNDDDDAL